MALVAAGTFLDRIEDRKLSQFIAAMAVELTALAALDSPNTHLTV